jgi:pimeloyl-ACP methyl ester carboxylesterase
VSQREPNWLIKGYFKEIYWLYRAGIRPKRVQLRIIIVNNHHFTFRLPKAIQETIEFMNMPEHWSRKTLTVDSQKITYHLYQNPNVKNGRRLVALHGAGVAGMDTWAAIVRFLDQWQEVLVPDQRGMGDTCDVSGEEHLFTAHELMGDLSALVDYLGWWTFDLAGYSMGGMVALLYKQKYPARVEKQYLLESALLDRPTWEATVTLRQHYSEAAKLLRGEDKETGIRNFMDTISPNRRTSEQVDQLTIARLGHRPVGFANALDCVTEAINSIDRDALIAAQGDVTSFIGGLSVDPMHHYHSSLAERMPNWHYVMLPGTDHSLPYQKPRQIARIMNDELKRFLS